MTFLNIPQLERQGADKAVKPNFGDKTKEEGDETYFQYEFEVVDGVGEIDAGPQLTV